MPRYYEVKDIDPKEWRDRVIDNLLKLRKQLKDCIPNRKTTNKLRIATWNIRDFGARRFNPRRRLAESYLYIAEIISNFDVVAIQEVNRNMKQFRELMYILGNQWKCISTDTTEGRKGNQERLVFIYDTSKVQFMDIAGEMVLQDVKLIDRERQFARTPFLVSFQSGWLRFNMCTVHIYFADDTTVGIDERVKEIKAITGFLADKSRRDKICYIVLGDFNIPEAKSKTMDALKSNGFFIPEELWGIPSTPFTAKHYDQIAFREKEGKLKFTGKGGVIHYYDSVFRDDEADIYITKYPKDFERIQSIDAKRRNYSKGWRTWQMSDHLPMWIELEIDFTEDYLKSLKSKE